MRNLCVLLTGLKPSRYREWRDVVLEEGRKIGWGTVIVEITKGALKLGGVSKRTWRRRLLRGCLRCPIYDRSRHACRKEWGQQKLGCGCWMPAKALVRENACWKQKLGERVAAFE